MLVLVRDNAGAGLQVPQGLEFAVAQVPPSLHRSLLLLETVEALPWSRIPVDIDEFDGFDDAMSSF